MPYNLHAKGREVECEKRKTRSVCERKDNQSSHVKMMPSPPEQTAETANSAQQNLPREINSQYSSCETLDSHRSSEYDDEAIGSDEKSKRTRRISTEHTDYICKERITRAAPPKPAYNPMQFIAQKPSNLVQSAQAQLKKAEEVKKTKETVRKEEPEEWQNVNMSQISRNK